MSRENVHYQDLVTLNIFIKESGEDIAAVIYIMGDIFTDNAMNNILPFLKEGWQEASINIKSIQDYIMRNRTQGQYNYFIHKLETRGLLGVQLKLKMLVIKHLRSAFLDSLNTLKDTNVLKDINMINIFKQSTHIYFGIVNSIFKSLIFIPGVDAIDEIKNVVENLMSWK